jgi:transposase
MKPMSLDLRERIIEALREEPSSLKVARRFKVSASAVRKLRLKLKRTGDLAPRPLPGRERLVQGETEDELRRLVGQYPDATLLVLCELLEDEAGVGVSETTMWRQLGRMGITLKKSPSTLRKETVRT